MDILVNILFTACGFLPLMCGAYISFLILRFPDLTVEASWSLASIGAVLITRSWFHTTPWLSPIFGAAIGAACGAVAAVIFVGIGRAKLLSGLISYWILVAGGFHLLGTEANAQFAYSLQRFGFPQNATVSTSIYVVAAIISIGTISVWQASRLGIASRIIGERPNAYHFFNLGRDRYYVLGLILSNALVGFGGGLNGSYYGYATNAQGIGLVIKAFFALLIGDGLLRVAGYTKRPEPLAIVVGTILLFTVTQTALEVYQRLPVLRELWLRPTDTQWIEAGLLMLVLMARHFTGERRNGVSEW